MSNRFSIDELAVFLHDSRAGIELWVQHPDYPELHVSNLGGVLRNCQDVTPWPSGKGGYPTITVRGRRRRVHHLVLEAFVCHRPEGKETCHYDGCPTNNRLHNLRWGTPKENAADRRRHIREWKRRACPSGPNALDRLRARGTTERGAELKELLRREMESV